VSHDDTCITGNGVDFWFDNQPHSLGTIAQGGSASYFMQGRFGYACEWNIANGSTSFRWWLKFSFIWRIMETRLMILGEQ
jgi:hypothetical protein